MIDFPCGQGFEGSIVAENFGLLDPSSNNPLVHGEPDNGGGLVSFQRVSRNSFHSVFLIFSLFSHYCIMH